MDTSTILEICAALIGLVTAIVTMIYTYSYCCKKKAGQEPAQVEMVAHNAAPNGARAAPNGARAAPAAPNGAPAPSGAPAAPNGAPAAPAAPNGAPAPSGGPAAPHAADDAVEETTPDVACNNNKVCIFCCSG